MNYQKKLDETLTQIEINNTRPELLLHSCCGPCSSYVLEYLDKYFNITVFYYNPNIFPKEEYEKRKAEQLRLIEKMPAKYAIRLIEEEYNENEFCECIKGYENEAEGGERCFKCYELRMERAAQKAKDMGFDYFTTVISVSPYKNAQKLNEIGGRLEKLHGISFLYADFKKKGGYQRSIELSREYNLYRQEYCGCKYSLEKTRNEDGLCTP